MTLTISPEEGSCELHRRHDPEPLLLVKHHVRPQSWGGNVTNTRLAVLDGTAHWNVHRCLDWMYQYGGPDKVPWTLKRKAGRTTWALAEEGWNSTPAEDRVGPTL